MNPGKKIVIVNHSDSRGGASVVSVRLLDALQSLGADASMLVTHKDSTRPDIVVAGDVRKPFLLEHGEIFLRNGLSRANLFKASTARFGLPVSNHPLIREADVVMLNWVNQGMLSLKEIERMAADGKRIIWTMHDMWNMTGICHHAQDCRGYLKECGRCPLIHLPKHRSDLSHSVLERKSELYSRAGITFVAVSNWLAARARESSLLKNQDVRVIPNAFPVEEFSIRPEHIRAELGLPEDKKLIIMGAARLDDPIKGLPMAVEALNKVHDAGQDDCAAVFFGNLRDRTALDSLRMPRVWLGPQGDFSRIRSIYAHGDVVLSSSQFETLPGTLIEGQAAGCYPVAFDAGGQRDIIDTPDTGWLAPAYDTSSLAQGILKGLTTPPSREQLHTHVATRFSARTVASRYLDII